MNKLNFFNTYYIKLITGFLIGYFTPGVIFIFVSFVQIIFSQVWISRLSYNLLLVLFPSILNLSLAIITSIIIYFTNFKKVNSLRNGLLLILYLMLILISYSILFLGRT